MNEADKCKTCKGKKTIKDRKVLEVVIEKGMKNGQKIKFRGEADEMRQYFTQIRQEVGGRLVERVYNSPDGKASKWWVCFSKRKFLNMELH